MQTRSTLTRLGLVVGLPAILLSVAAARAQQQVDWDGVEIATHHVRGTVHYVSGRGGNIGLSVGDDGVLMVDDQFAPLTDRILEAIGGISNGDIRFVINTHVHGDHVGGNENLGRMGILWREILPNVLPLLIVLFTLEMGIAVIVEAILSYVNLSLASDFPTWGGMISDGRKYVNQAPWLMILPILCVIALVLALNALGDGLKDALDPVMRK